MSETKKTADPRDELDKKRDNIVATDRAIKASLEQSEQSIQLTNQELTEFQGRIDHVYGTFTEAYRRLDQIPLVTAFVIGIIYYAIYFPLNWPVPFNWSAVDGLLTAMATFFILRIVFIALRVQVTANLEGSRVDNALSNVRTFSRRLFTGVRSYLPFVDEYYSGEERFQRQQAFIGKLRNALIQYGFVINKRVESYLHGFTSASDNDEAWLDDASENLSVLFGELQVIFRLAYSDHEDDEGARKVAWGSICKSRQTLDHFTTILLSKSLFNVPKSYQEPVKPAIEYIVRIISPLADFTIVEARAMISQSFSELEIEKRDFLRMFAANNISLFQGDRETFSNLLPIEEQPHDKLLVWLGEHTGVESFVLELFFFDFLGRAIQRDAYFSTLKTERKKIMVLSKELFERNIVSMIKRDDGHKKQDISNLTDYLETIHHYDKITITHQFSRYSSLFEYSRSIQVFLESQQICSKEEPVSFEILLTEIENPETDFLAQLKIMTQTLIQKYSSYSSHVEWLEPIALASMTVFLVDSEDFYLRETICKGVSGKGRAVKILYEYSWTNWDEHDKSDSEKTPLNDMIKRVLDGRDRDPVHLTEFSRYLASGYLYKRIKDIPTGNLGYVETQIANLSNKMDFKSKLERHLKALNNVLQTRLLKPSTIMESLRMQLVGAYAITVPSSTNVLTQVIVDLLPDVCNELAVNNPKYLGLFMKSEAEKVSIGKNVRVGVVPFRMDFAEFVSLFETAYRTAVERYEQSGRMKYSLEEYVSNIIRIFPTSAYFRQLTVESRKTEDILADIIKPLMIEKFGDVKTLEIIASLTVPDQREVAMKNVMTDLYDNYTDIYSIAQPDLDATFAVSTSPSLTDHIKNGLLDGDLKRRFNMQNLSELAKSIYQSISSGSESSIREVLRNHIVEICKEIRAKPSDDYVDRISAIIFESLNDIGMILNSLNA